MKKSHIKAMIIMLLGMILLLGGIFGYQVYRMLMMKKVFSQMPIPPQTVSAMKAAYQTWQPNMQAAGSLRAVNGVDVTTEVAGLVHTIPFKPGADVKAGDVLVELNSDADVAQLHALQATANLAETTYKRDKAQYAIKAISKAVLDADEADLKNKQAQVEQQQAMLEKKTIRAPFDGRLGVSAVNIGQYVNPGDKIVTLQSLSPIYVDFYLPQQALVHLAKGQSVTLTTDAYPDRTFTGEITTIDPKVDIATRNIQIEAVLSNDDNTLLPGMFGTVETQINEPQQYITVPQTAVSFNPYGEVAFVIHESDKDKDVEGKPKLTVTQTFIKTGEKRGDQVAVLQGLNEGDSVVTSGQLKLKNGTEVTINNTVMPADEANPKVEEE
jgi:membrane fusion protein (multidrug efflux system)